MRFGAFLLLAVCATSPAFAQKGVSVDETKLRAVLKSGKTVVQVPVSSTLERRVRAYISLEWLDPQDIASPKNVQVADLPPGASTIEIPAPLDEPSIWTRLRYSVETVPGDRGSFPAASGIVALGQIADYVFELHSSYPGAVRWGDEVEIRLQAIHPITRRAVDLASIEAEIKMDEEKPLRPMRLTHLKGGLVLATFRLPKKADEDDDADAEDEDQLDLHVRAKNGDFEQEVLPTLNVRSRPSARIQTDKPIYQPSQTIHTRAVLLKADGTAAAEREVHLKISVNSEVVHRADLKSSKFGVVSDDWALPESSERGAYTLEVLNGDFRLSTHVVQVSRYDLPTFQVKAEPQRKYWLPGQKPKVTIEGRYLFGKPVPHGHVRLVRNRTPIWNPGTRRSDPNDEQVAEGDANAEGVLEIELDIAKDFNSLTSNDTRVERVEGLHFAAYYRDPSSGKTEQRRFDIRITREPIHLYPKVDGDRAFILASYADGRPASVDVRVTLEGKTNTVRTNRYGVARWAYDGQEGEVQLAAVDSAGLKGNFAWAVGGYRLRERSPLRIHADKTIHGAGEAVRLHLQADDSLPPDLTAVVAATIDGRVISSRTVTLESRAADLVFPAQAEFHKVVTFAAWHALTGESVTTTSAIFPDSANLQLAAAAERREYKPGENAGLRIQAKDKGGNPISAAIGLAAIDQAVVERARTDEEFGSRPWFACSYCASRDETEIGGVRLADLYTLNRSKVTPELDLVAEALVAGEGAFFNFEESETFEDNLRFAADRQFGKHFTEDMKTYYAAHFRLPETMTEATQALSRETSQLRDPWNSVYRPDVRISGANREVGMRSPGPDKKFGTSDDRERIFFARPWFAPWSRTIEDALKGLRDYPRDIAELDEILREKGILLNTVRDVWGRTVRAHVTTYRTERVVVVRSNGPDGIAENDDDVQLNAFRGRYFQRETDQIRTVLQTGASPATREEFAEVVIRAGVDLSAERDAWGHPWRLTARARSQYVDRRSLSTIQQFGGEREQRTTTTPVTRHSVQYSLRSDGPDSVEGTWDDFDIATFVVVTGEESAGTLPPATPTTGTPNLAASGTGSLSGVVLDPSGAAIANAIVLLKGMGGVDSEFHTNEGGEYSFAGVPAGRYRLSAAAAGFQSHVVEDVPITAGKVTVLNIELNVGGVTQTVEVSAKQGVLQTASAQVAEVQSGSTPRVREYFPETLVWLPELVTDAAGNATAKFRLADNITTWKAAVIASTVDGRFAEAEAEIRAFQPFFLDFDPPQILTQGDRLELPVTVRNYLSSSQKVQVDFAPNDWAKVEGSLRRDLTVESNASRNATLAIQAVRSSDKAAQQITATARSGKDAIERKLRIHPDGQQFVSTAGGFSTGDSAMRFEIPANAIANANRAEVRVYPNLASVLLESARSILTTPHGCGEQTVSTGFANLIALRLIRSAGIRNEDLERRLARHVAETANSLRSMENEQGGFPYWRREDPDPSVTAYALLFLLEAGDLAGDNAELIRQSVHWLESKQTFEAYWKDARPYTNEPPERRTLVTALVTRSLSAAKKAGVVVAPKGLAAAIAYLEKYALTQDEPYAIALYLRAAMDTGLGANLGRVVDRLRAMARPEAKGVYWDIRTNTPFYGWGTAGRMETTGTVIGALSAWRTANGADPELDATIRSGVAFLLNGRDQSGMWHSTQATVLGMRALAESVALAGEKRGGALEVRINGKAVRTVSLPENTSTTEPIPVDISAWVLGGENKVEFAPIGGASTAMLALRTEHWIPWTATPPKKSPELRLEGTLSETQLHIGQPARIAVKAERVGFRGYGMMIAEVGLPPGADVDRASLEEILEKTPGVSRYEVEPDRVLFYLWPHAGGVSFDVIFSPRMAMTAKSEPMRLYDYYNPEAVSVIEPVLVRAQ